MSYYAYFLGKDPNPARPIAFIYNGGPGSSTIWLHMGAFGPKRVVTQEDTHTPAAPYRLVDNDARCCRNRPGLYRRARHRLWALAGHRQGEGVLGR